MFINAYDLTDNHIAYCVKDSIQIKNVKAILKKELVCRQDGYVDVFNFAQWYVQVNEDSISHEYGSDSWVHEYDQNFAIGENLAINLNNLLQLLNQRE